MPRTAPGSLGNQLIHEALAMARQIISRPDQPLLQPAVRIKRLHHGLRVPSQVFTR